MSFYFTYDIYPSFYLKLISLRRLSYIHFYPIFPSDSFFCYVAFIYLSHFLSLPLSLFVQVREYSQINGQNIGFITSGCNF